MKTSTKFLIDRGVAVPLAWAANLAARAAAPILRHDHVVDPATTKTFAVAKLLGMGSIIQATPLLHDLRATFPHAKIVARQVCSNKVASKSKHRYDARGIAITVRRCPRVCEGDRHARGGDIRAEAYVYRFRER